MSISSSAPEANGSRVAAEFLQLQGRYSIDAANSRDQLLQDAHSLLIGGVAGLDAVWEALDSTPQANAIWCAVNALKQAKACLGQALAPADCIEGAAA